MATQNASREFPRRKFIILIFNAPASNPPQPPQIEPPLPPFTVTTRDGKVLHTVEEVTEHLLRAERLSDEALNRLLHDLGGESR